VNCNDFSIGIELEGTDSEPFSPQQYESLISVTDLLLEEYPCLNLDRIVGHSDVAPGRKTDPGPLFDWERYKNALHYKGNLTE
jgi:AmpD protein